MIAKSLFQGCECWLSGAVTGRDVFDAEPIMQYGDNPFYLCVRRYNKMEAAGDEVNARIDGSCRFNDFVDTGMRTTNHDDQSLRCVDGE